MDITKDDVTAITDAIAFVLAYFGDPYDCESKSSYDRFMRLAEKLINREKNLTRGDVEDICFALRLFIDKSGEALSIHSDNWSRFSGLLKRN